MIYGFDAVLRVIWSVVYDMDLMAVISVYIIFVPAAAILDMSLYLENKEKFT